MVYTLKVKAIIRIIVYMLYLVTWIDKYPELVINYQQTKLLRIFSRYENIKMVQYLVEKGANIHARNNATFIYALNNGHKDIVIYLLSLNVKIFAENA